MTDFRRRFYVQISIAFSGILALAVLLVLAGFDINRRANDAARKRAEIFSRNQSVTALAQLKSDSNEAQRYSEAIANILIKQDRLFDFSKELESLARNNRIGLGFSFGSEQPPSGDQPGTAGFSFTAQGKQEDLINFLQAIERTQFLVSVSSIDLTRGGDGLNATVNGGINFQ